MGGGPHGARPCGRARRRCWLKEAGRAVAGALRHKRTGPDRRGAHGAGECTSARTKCKGGGRSAPAHGRRRVGKEGRWPCRRKTHVRRGRCGQRQAGRRRSLEAKWRGSGVARCRSRRRRRRRALVGCEMMVGDGAAWEGSVRSCARPGCRCAEGGMRCRRVCHCRWRRRAGGRQRHDRCGRPPCCCEKVHGVDGCAATAANCGRCLQWILDRHLCASIGTCALR